MFRKRGTPNLAFSSDWDEESVGGSGHSIRTGTPDEYEEENEKHTKSSSNNRKKPLKFSPSAQETTSPSKRGGRHRDEPRKRRSKATRTHRAPENIDSSDYGERDSTSRRANSSENLSLSDTVSERHDRPNSVESEASREHKRSFRKLKTPETSHEESESDIPSQDTVKTTSESLLLEAKLSSRIFNEEISAVEDIWNILTYCYPKLRTKEEEEAWKSILFNPSSSPVQVIDKLPSTTVPRYIEEEGIFAGEPIPIAGRNLNRLENRILKELGYNWFEPNGKLRSLSNPYRTELVKLLFDDEDPDENENQLDKFTKFVPATKDPFQSMYLDPNLNIELVIDIGTIYFKHHPLFSKEHVLASNLEFLYAQYIERQELNLTERAEDKLKALREAVKRSKDLETSLIAKYNGQSPEAYQDISEEDYELIEQLKERCYKYQLEMKQTRQERDDSLKEDNRILAAVLDAWRDLKHLRDAQKFSNTSLKLNIVTIEVNDREDKVKWKHDIEEEFQDVKEESEAKYERNLRKYRKKMRLWVDGRKRMKEKAEREAESPVQSGRTKAEKPSEEGNGEDLAADGESSSENSTYSVSSKPTPPVKFDPILAKETVIEKFKELKRKPGEPKLVLELVRTSSITPNAQLPQGLAPEERRRKSARGTKIEFRIIFNRKEYYRAKERQLTSDFNAFFGLTVPINIKEWPESVKLELWETGKQVKERKICLIDLILPGSNVSIERSNTQKIQFINEETMRTNNSGVGSGVDFSISNKDYKDGLKTSGYVSLRIGWGVDKHGNILCPKQFDKIYKANQDLPDVSKEELHQSGDLKKLSENMQMDPNDPKNAMWLKALTDRHVLKSQREIEDSHGLLIPEQELEIGELCRSEEIDQSRRFRLLHLRDAHIPEFRNLKMIPATDDLIPSDIFKDYETRLKNEVSKRLGIQSRTKKHVEESARERDDGDRLEKIRELRLGVIKLFENSLKQITFEDLVLEEKIPDIGTLGLNLMSIFQPKRPLRPLRRERKKIQGTSLIDSNISVILNIVRAFNLPMRKDSEAGIMSTESVTGIPIFKKRGTQHGPLAGNYSTVKPFVEIWFQRNVTRTTTGLGSNPTWNQELQLRLNADNDDFSQSNLSKLDDTIYLNVFDEVAIDLLEDDRRRETDIHQRLERRWLGGITIPFSTLYSNGRIEGTFRLNSPSILLGYEAQGIGNQYIPNFAKGTGMSGMTLVAGTGPAAGALGKNVQSNVQLINQKSAFVTLFITLQPAISPMTTLKEEVGTGESYEMLSHVKTWQNTLKLKYPDRQMRPFVMNPEGETVLCMRYLQEIEPPEEVIQQSEESVPLIQKLETLAHYVSLYPTVRDSTLGILDYGLWFTPDVFISTPGGGIEDHAVLLAGYFLHLEVPTWILQGNAVPDGPTTYVLTSFKKYKDDAQIGKTLKNAVLIWNPCTGEYFNVNDTYCTLEKVWAVVGKYNIWGNISEFERPIQVDWDLDKTKSWCPLFSKPISEEKLQRILTGPIKYKESDQVQASSLAQRVERHLKDAFMKWRKSSKTNWNRYCSAILRRLLPRLEEKHSTVRNEPIEVHGNESSLTLQSTTSPINLHDEHFNELREIMNSYQMTGFPLQQPYFNMETLTETIYATGVHRTDTPGIEFGIGAFAKSYPGSVYSIWIYIAALHRHNNSK